MNGVHALFEQLSGGFTTVPAEWLSVTTLRAIQQGDPFLLWAKYWGEEIYGFQPDPEEYSLLSFLSKMGAGFEARWTKEVMPEAVQVLEHDHECRESDAFKKSLKALHSNAQALTKVALWNADLKMYGTADLCVRAGFLQEKFPELSLHDPDNKWIICDCKFSSRLGENSRKSDFNLNATQVRVYSFMLAQMMGGSVPSKAFLITRDRPYHLLSVPIEHQEDGQLDAEIINMRDQAADIKLNGWRYRPWRGDPEVAPNFGNTKDEPWSDLKSRFKELMQPLELLPGVGKVKADVLREAGFENMKSLLAAELDSLNLRSVRGIGKVTEMKIKSALLANKTGRASIIPASIIPPHRDIQIFLDFEFFPSIHCPLDDPNVPFPECLTGTPMIFLAGVGTETKDGTFHFRHFLARREDHESEKKMLLEMLDYIEELGVFASGQTSAVYHFSGAEVQRCREAVLRHGEVLERLKILPFVDLQAAFKKNHIALPGCWGYGLKEISSAISKLSPTHAVSYPDQLSQAAVAMVMGWSAYQQPDPADTVEMRSLLAYLETDCKAMWQALRWLRENAGLERKASGMSANSTGWYSSQITHHSINKEAKEVLAGWYRHCREEAKTLSDRDS